MWLILFAVDSDANNAQHAKCHFMLFERKSSDILVNIDSSSIAQSERHVVIFRQISEKGRRSLHSSKKITAAINRNSQDQP